MRSSRLLNAVLRVLEDGANCKSSVLSRAKRNLGKDGCVRGVRTVSLDMQSQVLPGDERIHVSALLTDPHKLMSVHREFEHLRTIFDVMRHTIEHYAKQPCLGTRDPVSGQYEWLDYQQVFERSMYTGSAFQELGLNPGNDTFIGINCKNRPEYSFTYLGCSAFSNVFIPLYDNLDAEAIKYIISITEVPFFLCDTETKARFLMHEKKSFPKLKYIVTVNRPSRDLISDGKAVGIDVLGFLDFEMMGKLKPKQPVPPKPDDLFTICWTSGTTGMPKGAMITHKMLVSIADCMKEAIKPADLGKGKIISYMPTGHIYEVIIQVQTFAYGGGTGFFRGDVLGIMDDIQALKPTAVPMVPRLLNRLYAKVNQDIQSSTLKRTLLPIALKRKEALIRKGVVTNNTIWDKLVFKSARDTFGGNVELITNSAAPLSPEVSQFFRCALGCYLFDAYGQTEVGPVTLTNPLEFEGGHVGAPVPTVQVKLVDVPEMNYFAKDNVGEVCARGPTVCLGYFKNPDATKDTITEDGWLRTGDIGQWLPNKTLKIIDRKKNFFKLSQGEFIAPDKLESSYGQSAIVAQIFVDGRSDQNYLIAVVVPDPLAFPVWAKRKGLPKGTVKELADNKEVRKEFLKHLRKLGKKNGMNSLELIQNLHLHPDLLTAESGLITPTMKIKRNEAKKRFHDAIDTLYKEGALC